MPSLNLTTDLVPHVRCLPGTALIRCSPPPLTTDSGLVIPDASASWAQENQAIREGVIVTINRAAKGVSWVYKNTGSRMPRGITVGPSNSDKDSMSLDLGMTVLYLGRQDEANDDYVVVKIGQIVAVKETGK